MKETKEHYETVCQTRYVEVKSTENKIDCHMVNKEMCMKDDDACEKGTDGCNCIPYQERVSLKLFTPGSDQRPFNHVSRIMGWPPPPCHYSWS